MGRWTARVAKGADNVRAIGTINAAAANMRRAKVYDLSFGCNAAPADNAFEYQAIRVTDLGTASGVTLAAVDPGDAALSAGATIMRDTYTANPTFSGTALLNFPLNQRASMRWIAAPGGEIIVPATANNGIALAIASNSTTTFAGSMTFEEL